MLNSLLIVLLLCAISAFFSLSEISLAASRRIKLKVMIDEGNTNAAHVLRLQEAPGMFFTVVPLNTIDACGEKDKVEHGCHPIH